MVNAATFSVASLATPNRDKNFSPHGNPSSEVDFPISSHSEEICLVYPYWPPDSIISASTP
jgi:hypothetical protein